MICPRSLVLNGTFREFSDGFEELGIPRTGSAIPSALSLLYSTAFPSSRSGSPISIAFALSLYLSRSGFRTDSIKRLFAATKRRVRCFVRDASHFSPRPHSFSLSSLLRLSPYFLLCIFRFLYSSLAMRRCRLRFISANEFFRDARRRFILEWKQFGG